MIIMLAVIPAAVWAALATPPPIPVKVVTTEGIRAARMDSETFRVRWASVSDLPPATVISIREVSAALPPPDAPVSKPATKKKTTRRASLERADLCQRHRMHKVYYGRRWRCRR